MAIPELRKCGVLLYSGIVKGENSATTATTRMREGNTEAKCGAASDNSAEPGHSYFFAASTLRLRRPIGRWISTHADELGSRGHTTPPVARKRAAALT